MPATQGRCMIMCQLSVTQLREQAEAEGGQREIENRVDQWGDRLSLISLVSYPSQWRSKRAAVHPHSKSPQDTTEALQSIRQLLCTALLTSFFFRDDFSSSENIHLNVCLHLSVNIHAPRLEQLELLQSGSNSME